MDSNKQQTAVEWLENELYEKFEVKGDYILYSEILYKAKEMEKEQINDAYLEGGRKGFNFFGDDFEKYYNETFKQ